MARSQDVLPFAKESTTRLLPWIVGVMVYLAAVMTAGAMLLAGVAADWNRDLTGSFTVQIPPAEKNAGGSEKARVDRARQLLQRVEIGTEPQIVEGRGKRGPEVDALGSSCLGIHAIGIQASTHAGRNPFERKGGLQNRLALGRAQERSRVKAPRNTPRARRRRGVTSRRPERERPPHRHLPIGSGS